MRIVIVSPFPSERSALEELLRWEGHDVRSAAGRDEALALAATNPPDVIIVEAQMPGIDVVALARELESYGPHPQTILLCPRSSRVLDELDVVCLIKPIDLAQLYRQVALVAPARSRAA